MGTLIFSNNNFYYFNPLTSKTNKPEFYCVNLCNGNGEKMAVVRINNMISMLKKDVIKIAKLIKYEDLLKSKNPSDIKYSNLLKKK